MIRVLDRDFSFLGEVDDFENFIFTQRLHSYGEFELSINSEKKNAQLLTPEKIIYLDSGRVGIIGYSEEQFSHNNKILTVKGFTPEFFLTYRITEPFPGADNWSYSGSGETVIKKLVEYNLGPDANRACRRIPYFRIKNSLNKGKYISFETCYKKLNEEIALLAEECGLGIKAEFNTSQKCFDFDVICGRDLTAGQNINPPIIFAPEFDNVFEQTYIYSDLDFKNVAIAASKGEGTERTIVSVNDAVSGDQRRELFADAKSVAQEDVEKLQTLALGKLAEHPKIISLDGKINPYHTMKYGKDYLIGDTVNLKFKNIILTSQITEVTESWDIKNGYSVDCVFGNKVPDLISIIKKNLRS